MITGEPGMVSNAERGKRVSRGPDLEGEVRALHRLAGSLDAPPSEILSLIAALAADMYGTRSGACSAGVSLMQQDNSGKPYFKWVAISGPLSGEIGRMTPREASPCGECLRTGSPILFERPDLQFPYLKETEVEFAELLVVPFTPDVSSLSVGTVWLATHPPTPRLIDYEDERLLKSISAFGARAFTVSSRQSVTARSSARDPLIYSTPHREGFLSFAVNYFPRFAGVISLAAGVLILLGWALDMPSMQSFFLDGITIKPATALGIILAASTLLLILPRPKTRWRWRLAGLFALTLLLVSVLVLTEYFTGNRFFSDGMLAHWFTQSERVGSLQMAAVTAVGLLFLAAGFLNRIFLHTEKTVWYSNLAFTGTAMISMAALLWYAYGAFPAVGQEHSIQIALPTALLLLLISTAGILSRPDSRFMRSILADRAGGILASKYTPFVFLIPLSLGLLRKVPFFSNPGHEPIEEALTATLTLFAFGLLFSRSADALNKLDERRDDLDIQRSRLLRVAEGERVRADEAVANKAVVEEAYRELHEVTVRQRATDAYLSAALKSSPVGVVLWDKQLRIIRVSSSIAGWNKRDPDYFAGKTLEETAPYIAHVLTPVLNEVVRTGTSSTLEFDRPANVSDGIARRLNGIFYPVAGDDGEIIGVGGFLNDVTREHADRQQISEINERYDLAARATNDAVWDLDMTTGSMVWNEAIVGLSGCRLADIGRTLSWREERIHEDDHDEVLRSFYAAVEAGASKWEGSYRFRRADGSFARVFDRAYILRGPDGKPRRAIGAMSDRTLQTALESSLRQSQKMDAVGRLSAGVAHDFNNVLAVISISAEFLLAEMGAGSKHMEEVLEIKKAAERGGRLTRQLLAFTRQQVVSPTALDLNRVLDEMFGMVQRLVPPAVKLVLHRPSSLPFIKADSGQIEQIVMNLVVNACDAMSSGGTLRIETGTFSGAVPCGFGGPQGEFVTLSVSDTGCGMSEETISHIFDPFFTTKEVGKGTGLGLATVHGIVKQNGGEICVGSAEGRGSIFTIYLPVLSLPKVGTPQEGPPTDVPRTSNGQTPAGKTVLLAEDDHAIRKSVERILARAGFLVLAAENGAEALALAEAHSGRIDLVLTDARMPVMGGAELIRRLQEEKIATRALMMSGYVDEIEKGALQNGVVAFIQKPFSPDSLLNAVNGAVEQRQVPPVS